MNTTDAARGRGPTPSGGGEESAATGSGAALEPSHGDDAEPAAPAAEDIPWDWADSLEIVEHAQADLDIWGDVFLDSMTASCSHAVGRKYRATKHTIWPPLPANLFDNVSSILTGGTIARLAHAIMTQLQA